jgi:micrococcal nuclease
MRRVALAVLVLLAGCTVSLSPTTTTPTETAQTATVVDVVDGDTVDVRFADGREDTVRLLGVDVPETRGEVHPDEFEGVPDTEAARECLRRVAEDATAFARDRLADREVRVATDPAADRRGGYGRLLAYVAVGDANRSFNRALLERGYARVYVSDFSRLSAFREAAADAKAADRGVWGCDG